MPNGPLERAVSLQLDAARRPVADRNVACLLPGTDPRQRDTAIAFTAHYDHLGTGAPDERGDSIYNGFSDNAAGVAMLLAIARAMQTHAKPRHSALFLFFTGEEHGLLGSDYYVARPLWPLARVRGVINLDAGAPAAQPASWRIAGDQGSPLGLLAVDVALARGWSATTSAARANSDHFPFARSGVPAIAIIPGPGPYEGLTTDSSESLRRRWDFYHQPGDEWSAEFPLSGLRRYAEYAYLIALALDRGLSAVGETPMRQRR
jgi:Zn-dependent M28 family amino/carboxypeptidase